MLIYPTLKMSPIQGMMGMGGGATGYLTGGGAVSSNFNNEYLPSAYQTLISGSISSGYTMVYVDKESGSDSNSGTSFASPKQNYFNLFNSGGQGGVSAGTCIVVRGFHYVDWNNATNQLGVIDNNTSYMRVIAFPGQTLLRARNSNSSSRDHHVSSGDTTSTDVYGAILEKVRDSFRTTNYMTAFHAPSSRGRFYNCVFRSVNTSNVSSDPDTNAGVRTQSNSLFSMHYDNGNNIDTDQYQCTYLGTWNNSNYTGGSNCDIYNSNGNDSATTTSGTNSSNSWGVSLSSTFSPSNPARGVYGGTYAWNSSFFNARYSYGNPYE